jgi:hypothetical protein
MELDERGRRTRAVSMLERKSHGSVPGHGRTDVRD